MWMASRQQRSEPSTLVFDTRTISSGSMSHKMRLDVTSPIASSESKQRKIYELSGEVVY